MAAMSLFKMVDIEYFPLIRADNKKGFFDVAFVQGCVVRKEEIKTVKDIRKSCKILIALGTCATYGGIPSIKDFGYKSLIEREVYQNPTFLTSIDVYGIGQYVKVDYYLRGCPMIKEEFIKVLKDLVIGKKIPYHMEYAVCKECRFRENECLLQKGERCIGPLTYGGCNAICPSNGIPCYGCRGPLEDSNIDSIMLLLEEKGFSREDIRRVFVLFAGTSKRFEKIKW